MTNYLGRVPNLMKKKKFIADSDDFKLAVNSAFFISKLARIKMTTNFKI